jgi:DNA (cytosine-5)-methyltransferase 1
MIQGTKKLFAADLFCGAGGTTTGAEQSGKVEVALAINHWRPAIYTHQTNHPHVRHVCATIDHVDPHDFVDMKIDILMASPECIFHSNARGGKPVDDQRRATAWCVPRWAEVLRPKWIVIENVGEFEHWAPLGSDKRPLKSKKGEIFLAWIGAIRALGYHLEWKKLNAANFGGATSRTRLFIIARRGASKKPIPWPAPTHSKGNWASAASIIDWNRDCPSIFTRKRPLADKTIRRIEIGLRKFCGPDAEPFIVKLRRNATASGIDEPLGTITSGGSHHAIAQPFITSYHNGAHGHNRSSGTDEPLPVIDTNPRHAVVTPYLIDVNHGDDVKTGDRSYPVTEPLGTVTTKRGKALVTPFMVDIHDRRRDDKTSSALDPLPTIVTKPGNSLVLPFITEYYGTGEARSIDEPLSTVTTKPRHGLAMVKLIETMRELSIVDIGFRMLDVDELAAAQGFPAGYHLHGTKAEQIKQIGNSVHTHVARAICEAIGRA